MTVEEARRVLDSYIGPVYGGRFSGGKPFIVAEGAGGTFSLTPDQCYDVADALLTVASALEQGRRIEPEEDE